MHSWSERAARQVLPPAVGDDGTETDAITLLGPEASLHRGDTHTHLLDVLLADVARRLIRRATADPEVVGQALRTAYRRLGVHPPPGQLRTDTRAMVGLVERELALQRAARRVERRRLSTGAPPPAATVAAIIDRSLYAAHVTVPGDRARWIEAQAQRLIDRATWPTGAVTPAVA